jgi:hypothetical protein
MVEQGEPNHFVSGVCRHESLTSHEVWPPMGPHEEFLELCALSAGPGLTPEERARLNEHLAGCPECRKAAREFETIVTEAVPAMAEDLAPQAESDDPSFSPGSAEASFLRRVSEEDEKSRAEYRDAEPWLSPLAVRRSHRLRRTFDRYHFWMPLAAGLILSLSLAILTYRLGTQRGYFLASKQEPTSVPRASPSEGSLEAALRERDAAAQSLVETEKAIAELRREIAAKSGENEKLHAAEAVRQAALANTNKINNQLSEEHGQALEQAKASQQAFEASEKKLKHLEQERSEDIVHAASLEAKVAEMSRSLAEQKQMNEDLQELLAKDRDIRELMGTRELYITEVRDVLTTGETRKAFGRLYYSKGKTLIFYAYDLNDLPGLKRASSFQVWGNRGPDRNQALKLGVFSEDNASKKRWVMKVDDKRTLDQIDAVFVTIEPPGGSSKPSGTPLMYAYLKVNSNSP